MKDPGPLTSRNQPLAQLALSVLIILFAFLIRAHDLAGDSFWIDEITTVRDAAKGLGVVNSVRDHPPLLYFITYGILELIGDNDFLVRFQALAAGVLAIPLIMVFGRVIGRPRAGYWAAFLLALAPVHLRFAQMARHYTLLMLFSLASYLFLYLALSRPSAKYWAAYAIAILLNLYTHYAAFVVLASQAAVIALWMVIQLTRRRRSMIIYPIAAAGAVTILFLPILARFGQAFSRNVGATSVRGVYVEVFPITAWLDTAYRQFGFRADPLPLLFAGLVAAGSILLLWRRAWLLVVLSLASLLLPLAVIALLQTARSPNVRYIIHMLPMYLILSAVALDAFLGWLAELRPPSGTKIYVAGSFMIGALLIYFTLPVIQDEYKSQVQDWRGVAERLDAQAQEGAIVLGLSPETVHYNEVSFSLSYYLDRTTKSFQYLSGHGLNSAVVEDLAGMHSDIWAVVWLPGYVTPEDERDFAVTHLTYGLYMMRPEERSDSIRVLINLYERFVPLAKFPTPGCRMAQDLASLYVVADDPESAMDRAIQYSDRCADSPVLRIDDGEEFTRLLRELVNDGQTDQARFLANELLKYDQKHDLALEVLTHADLLQSFSASDAVINLNGAPEPVEKRTFTMPHNGDWGEVIFTHPPAHVSFDLILPDEPTELRARIALDPQSWPWAGDGVTFVVAVQEKGAGSVELFRHHLANEESDHDWLPVRVSLADYAGKEITLTLAAEHGPAGDGTGDWAGWESPRITWEP